MRTFLITAATAIAAIAGAAPAAAQYYPQGQNNGYNQNYGNGQAYGQQQYGYGGQGTSYNNYNGQVRGYIIRADQLRQRIERNDNRDRISEREAYGLRNAAIDLQQRARAYGRDVLSFGERRDLDVRLARLEQSLGYERRDGNSWNNGNSWGNGQSWDRNREDRRDREGRDNRGRERDDD